MSNIFYKKNQVSQICQTISNFLENIYPCKKVKGWTKKIDIFEKRMLIFPICEESHWYLVIVCNHGYVISKTREKQFDAKRSYQQNIGETKGFNPFIMVLDSLG